MDGSGNSFGEGHVWDLGGAETNWLETSWLKNGLFLGFYSRLLLLDSSRVCMTGLS